jgi:hypothetical protein
VQYLNNVLEQDHRAIKRRVRASQTSPTPIPSASTVSWKPKVQAAIVAALEATAHRLGDQSSQNVALGQRELIVRAVAQEPLAHVRVNAGRFAKLKPAALTSAFC